MANKGLLIKEFEKVDKNKTGIQLTIKYFF
jgi:hypothetical protein